MEISKVLRIKALTEKAGVDYWEVYRRQNFDEKKGAPYKSPMDLRMRTKLANTLVDELKPFFDALGFEFALTRKEDLP